MAVAPNQVFIPPNFQDLFSLWSRFPDASPYAGGAGFIRDQEKHLPVLPNNIISLENIPELRRIARTEKYLEIGAMVRLSEIMNLGKIVPEVLKKTIEGIAGFHIQNMVTIGGNLCDKQYRLDCSSPLSALDAQYELRSSASARWISASRFSATVPPALDPQEILTRIRIPLDQWNYSRYKKFKPPGSSEHGSVIVFIIRNEKDILTDLRITYSGKYLLQNKQGQNNLIGKHLPLELKDARLFIYDWKKYLDNLRISMEPVEELRSVQILNFIEDTISDFTD
ncbi:MAG: FAD binding domain-containing protein [Treponema sp.]|nr:FAD binding domain-containing protein [Treponema sp.]